MKEFLILLLSTALAVHALADETPYRKGLNTAHQRLRVLEAQREDARKAKAEFPQAANEERIRLVEKLLKDDPVWGLARQIEADLHALVGLRQKNAKESAMIGELKEFLAVISAVLQRANTREEAEALATTLRQFVARHDPGGAVEWAKSSF